MAEISPYAAMILQSRKVELDILVDQQRDIMSLFSAEQKRLAKILDELEYPSQTLKITQLKSAMARIESVMDDLYGLDGEWQNRRVAVGGKLEGLITTATSKAAQAGIDGKIKASVVLLNEANPDLIPDLPLLFGGIKEDIIRQMLTRPLADDKIFSQRLWSLKGQTENVISKTVTSGILQGKSAYEISKDLEQFMVLKGEGRAVKHGMVSKQPWNTKKIRQRTMTLARTEINNAFTESQIRCAMREPWNNGMKWNLSASHPKYDICDVYATQDLYKMGAGVYPPENVPVRHPRCLCYLTDVLKSIDEVAAMLKEDMQIPKLENALKYNGL